MSDVKRLAINGISYDIKAMSVNDYNSGNGYKSWFGLKADYNGIATKDIKTLYYITDTHEIYLGTNLISNYENELPSQSGNSGKFLTTNGSTPSWSSPLPSQSGNTGKYLQTNGTTTSWETIGDTLPSQTGNAGKFLTTNGSTPSWANVPKSRSIGEIVISDIPLNDSNLKLLDGSLISYNTGYNAFINYIGNLYYANPSANYFAQSQGQQVSTFYQPTLSADGTMGGSSFAVTGSLSSWAPQPVWKAFDNDASTYWAAGIVGSATVYFEVYNPTPLRLTKIEYLIAYNHYTTRPEAGTISGSNDGSTWYTVTNFNVANNGSTTKTISFNNSNYYKYYRVNITDSASGGTRGGDWYRFFTCKTISLTATYISSSSMTPEQSWQNQVSMYGVCGKFVYDGISNTVRLPKYGNKLYTYTSASSTTYAVDVYYYMIVSDS